MVRRKIHTSWLCPAVALGILLALTGAVPGSEAPENLITLPGGSSPKVSNEKGTLLVGFGAADMTSPPGVGLNGAGPGARVATGWHRHLYASAMVIQDSLGECVALVTCDMAHMSINIHRHVAARLLSAGIPLGPDRLLISATHSHSAGGNVLDSGGLNNSAGPLGGFDPIQEDFFVTSITRAVTMAWNDRDPAHVTAAWRRVDGCTWNRSYDAYIRNPDIPPVPPISPTSRYSDDSVDREWFMLRVARWDSSGTMMIPYGAYSSFAIHASGNAIHNDLLDPDLPGYPMRSLTGHIRSLQAARPAALPGAYHLVASGAAGDVAPRLDDEGNASATYRDVRTIRVSRRPGGQRTPIPSEDYEENEELFRTRRVQARNSMDALGGRLSRAADEVFDMPATMTLTPGTRISRAFETIDLQSRGGEFGLCPVPSIGLPKAGGSEGLRTPLDHWKLFGLISLGFKEGRSPKEGDREKCQGGKMAVLGPFIQGLVAKSHGGYPRHAQVMVVRLGDLWLCGLPGEFTTQAGRRMREQIADVAGCPLSQVRLIGLANGHIDYVTTPEEYAVQHYEGGSTLYGPSESLFFQEVVRKLARGILVGDSIPEVSPLTVDVGHIRSHFPRRVDTNRVAESPSSPDIRATSRRYDDHRAEIMFQWGDLPPGTLNPADGPLIEIRSGSCGATPRTLATDDSSDVEVRVTDWQRNHASWAATWIVPDSLRGDFSFRVLPRGRPADPGCLEFSLPLTGK